MILFHILSASGFPQLGPKMQGFLHFSKKYSKYEWFCDGGNILTASDFDILSVSLLRTIFFEYSKCESVAIHISALLLYYWLTNLLVHPWISCFLSFLCICFFICFCFVFSHVSLLYSLLISFVPFIYSLFIDYSFFCRTYSLSPAICLSIDLLVMFHSSIFIFLHSFCIV